MAKRLSRGQVTLAKYGPKHFAKIGAWTKLTAKQRQLIGILLAHKWPDSAIAHRLGVSRQLVRYWRLKKQGGR